ncbi:MAG TPA: hypothetical protein VH394_06950 [Thermoanaerobaculia bacterium]|nr:hypothetical protein [Thermoanaerobaculia bacterium]
MENRQMLEPLSQGLMAKSLRMSTEDPLMALRLARLATQVSMYLERLEEAPPEPHKKRLGRPPASR